MSGRWVFVCGPSGAGKDSVMACAQALLKGQAGFVFARRMVSRPLQAGSDHDPVTPGEFNALLQSGGMHWHWQAHGFNYGIAAHYAADVLAGRTVVVNGSRDHVNNLQPMPDLKIVEISASPKHLEARLLSRGRDSSSAVVARLERNAGFAHLKADLIIINDGELHLAGQRLADYLLSLSVLRPPLSGAT